jgi:hypothetical protein
MPIKIEFDPKGEGMFDMGGGAYYPVAICDICGQRIENIRLAAYLFDSKHDPLAERTVLETEIIFAHKGSCLRAAESRFPGSGWCELYWFPQFFEKNMTPDGDQGR